MDGWTDEIDQNVRLSRNRVTQRKRERERKWEK